MEENQTSTPQNTVPAESISEKNGIVCLLLCILVGPFGIHRFYVGKIGTGVLMLLTCGLGGIWVLVDLVLMICGSFTDAEGKKIKISN